MLYCNLATSLRNIFFNVFVYILTGIKRSFFSNLKSNKDYTAHTLADTLIPMN